MVLLCGILFAHFGHPLGLTLFVRSLTCARHLCRHFSSAHFHSALSCDAFVSLLGSFSLHSRRSLAPRRPLSLHHSTNDFPELFGRPMIASRSRRRRVLARRRVSALGKTTTSSFSTSPRDFFLKVSRPALTPARSPRATAPPWPRRRSPPLALDAAGVKHAIGAAANAPLPEYEAFDDDFDETLDLFAEGGGSVRDERTLVRRGARALARRRRRRRPRRASSFSSRAAVIAAAAARRARRVVARVAPRSRRDSRAPPPALESRHPSRSTRSIDRSIRSSSTLVPIRSAFGVVNAVP